MSRAEPETLNISDRPDRVRHITINRPERHNAFNDLVIAELTEAFEEAGRLSDCPAVLLTGAGPSFSAGADIEWMREQGQLGTAANRESGLRMARMFEAIRSCAKPVVAAVQGAALGGGTGLTAAVDIAIAQEDAKFGFTEVRLGIIPAVISPFVVEKLGAARARALFVLGSRFDGKEAERLGLVFRSCQKGTLAESTEEVIRELTKGAPGALQAAKALALRLTQTDTSTHLNYCADEIARLRSLPEAQEGLAAFLEKRRPSWIRES